ncbi:MAG: A24 family peptidase [Lachnospiraceae bacterium]|nr:A24 family peptidase [Lachnospiraceae bacterium]
MSTVVILGILLIATICDMRKGKIPNVLILVALILGPVIRYSNEGFSGVLCGMLEMMLLLFAGGLMYKIRVIGAGDVKLFCALTLAIGIQRTGMIVLFSATLGAFFAVFLFVKEGILWRRILYFANFVMDCVDSKELKHYGKDSPRINFCIFIFAGAIIEEIMFMMGRLGWF